MTLLNNVLHRLFITNSKVKVNVRECTSRLTLSDTQGIIADDFETFLVTCGFDMIRFLYTRDRYAAIIITRGIVTGSVFSRLHTLSIVHAGIVCLTKLEITFNSLEILEIYLAPGEDFEAFYIKAPRIQSITWDGYGAIQGGAVDFASTFNVIKHSIHACPVVIVSDDFEDIFTLQRCIKDLGVILLEDECEPRAKIFSIEYLRAFNKLKPLKTIFADMVYSQHRSDITCSIRNPIKYHMQYGDKKFIISINRPRINRLFYLDECNEVITREAWIATMDYHLIHLLKKECVKVVGCYDSTPCSLISMFTNVECIHIGRDCHLSIVDTWYENWNSVLTKLDQLHTLKFSHHVPAEEITKLIRNTSVKTVCMKNV